MKKFKNQSWHEPEQEQFLRYMKDNKILEIIQPSLSLISELPVKPDDLYAFFAEYLGNGAKISTQISLLRAELCFKENELEEAISRLVDLFSELKTAGITQTPITIPGGEGSYYHHTEHSDIQLISDKCDEELNHVLEFIEEYHELDPFGVLLDFDPPHTQHSQLQQSDEHEQYKAEGETETHEYEVHHKLSPMDKLTIGLAKFQKSKNKTASNGPADKASHSPFGVPDFEEGRPVTSPNQDASLNAAMRKKLFHVFHLSAGDKSDKTRQSDSKSRRKDRRVKLEKLVKRYLRKMRREYSEFMNENENGYTSHDGIPEATFGRKTRNALGRGAVLKGRGPIASPDFALGEILRSPEWMDSSRKPNAHPQTNKTE